LILDGAVAQAESHQVEIIAWEAGTKGLTTIEREPKVFKLQTGITLLYGAATLWFVGNQIIKETCERVGSS